MRIRDGVRKLLTPAEVDRLERAGFGREAGIGRRPAMVVIDAQRYMVAPDASLDADFPSSCGDAGRTALAELAALLTDLRAARVPIFYTRFELARDGSDIGAYGRK